MRTPIVDLRADTGQIYRNLNVSPRAFFHYFNENFNYFTQLPLKMNKNVCKQKDTCPQVFKDILQLREKMSVLPLPAMVIIFGLWVRQFTFLVKQTSFV